MEERLTMKSALGYSLGGIAQSGIYNLIGSYMLLYLTSVVGMKTELAGTIVSFGMIMEMLSGLVIGKMSDSCTSRIGRRRPFMMASAVLFLPSIILIYSKIGGDNSANMFVPYLIISGIFWISHSLIYVPYTAWGAESPRITMTEPRSEALPASSA